MALQEPLSTPRAPATGWRARQSPIHRLGLYTTRAFIPGEIILSEPALATYSHDDPLKPFIEGQPAEDLCSSDEPYEPLQQAMSICIPASEAEEMKSSRLAGDRWDLLTRLCLAMKHGGLPTPFRGVLVQGAYYTNHHCTPNAFAGWNEDSQRFIVRANTSIPADHEITISYINNYLQQAERQKQLKFWCNCAYCNGERKHPEFYFTRLDGLWPAVLRLRTFLLRHNEHGVVD